MRLTLSILGAEVLSIEFARPQPDTERGDCTTYPVGFTPPHPVPDEAQPPGVEVTDA